MFILNANKPQELTLYLLEKKWLQENETILSLSKPGEGNMNYVLRVETSLRTFIIKQSRAYVEKYPQIAAPENRVVTEAAFYSKIATKETIQKAMPKLLGLDVECNILVLEDLGNVADYSLLYDLKTDISTAEIAVLTMYLNALHDGFKKNKVDDELANVALRQLNYEHIFKYPFAQENGFDLDTIQDGLQEMAAIYKNDHVLKMRIDVLGFLYLEKGKYLLHGDYYPGSWLKTLNGIKIIDPEFCYYGMREFDLGVLIAHLYLTNQKQDTIESIATYYKDFAKLDVAVLNGFIGVEIMRRVIGLAQLPIKMELKKKSELMKFAYKLIIE